VPLRGFRVSDFIYEDVQTLRPDDRMQLVLDLMPNAKYGAFVVVDDERRPVGIVTETDLIKRVLVEAPPGGAFLRTITASYEAALRYVVEARRAHGISVADIMTAPVVTLDADRTLHDAAAIFGTRPFKHLPVTRDGVLIGMIRGIDLIGPAIAALEEGERGNAAGGTAGAGDSSAD
jgi:CBS domain-containing protein